jgi:hypothetical protein
MADETSGQTEAQESGAAVRVRRYTMLRSAQRALYPMRPMPGSLPADRALREIRHRLRAIGPDPRRGEEDPVYASVEDRRAALSEVDEMLGDVSRELRSMAERIPFSEHRATLPQLYETRPDEVAALLDLCLEDPRWFASLRHLIDYLVTLLSTVSAEGNRRVWSDPVGATPRLREICESYTEYDLSEIAAHVEVFDDAILDLPRHSSIEPVIHRVRDYKAQVGPLMLVPELLRKIIEYNVAVSNRLEEVLEAERTIHELEGHTPPTAEAPGRSDETPSKQSIWHLDGSDLEVREGKALFEIADSISRTLSGGRPEKGPAGNIARALDLTSFSSWETEAFAEAAEGPEAEILRMMVVVGLLTRQMDEVQGHLAGTGLEPARLQSEWVERLERVAQEVIAVSLGSDRYESAKQLAQTKAKFLFPNRKHASRPERAAFPVAGAETSRGRPPRARSRRRGRRPAGERGRRPAASGAGCGRSRRGHRASAAFDHRRARAPRPAATSCPKHLALSRVRRTRHGRDGHDADGHRDGGVGPDRRAVPEGGGGPHRHSPRGPGA